MTPFLWESVGGHTEVHLAVETLLPDAEAGACSSHGLASLTWVGLSHLLQTLKPKI